MSPQHTVAKEYLDRVLRTQKALGYKSAKVTSDGYAAALRSLTRSFGNLESVKTRRSNKG